MLAPLVNLCCLLVSWLNLRLGVSRSNSNIILQALQLIVGTTVQLIFEELHSAGYNFPTPVFSLPKDIRTVYGMGLEPEIIRTACCPKCYKPYKDEMPAVCQWRRSRRAHICGRSLWKLRNTRKGAKQVPECQYSTQSFESWLRFFLARPQIEAALEESFRKTSTWLDEEPNGPMHDIQDSPAWRSLQDYLLTKYHLVFSVFIDWFNPYGNKIAGDILLSNILYCLTSFNM